MSIDGKSVVVVEIFPGNLKPYYVKSKGKIKGTYIRVGATNKLADMEMLNELERQRRNIHFDEEIMYEYENLDKIDLEKLEISLSKLTDRAITKIELENLKLLKSDNGKTYPTRGLVLLCGDNDEFEYARIKCARFKGNDINEFIDKKQFSGILYEQVDNAVNFAKTHIAKRGVIKDTKREDNYVIPIIVIREAIINAVVHRDYSISGSDIKFAIFDDRVEITSPGVLPKSLTIDDIKLGKSEIRNKIIARVFNEINYIEQWGTGIKRIINECEKQGVPRPVFSETGLFFKVTIFTTKNYEKIKNIENIIESSKDNEKLPINDNKPPINDERPPINDNKPPINNENLLIKIDKLSNNDIKIIEYLKQNEYITNSKVRELINRKETATKSILKKLIEKQIIEAIGEKKGRKYIIKGEK